MNRRFGKTAAGRVGTAALMGALTVLVRNHPGIAMEMVGAGLRKAGSTGFSEIKDMLTPENSSDPSRG